MKKPHLNQAIYFESFLGRKVTALMEVNGEYLPLVAISLTWELNGIPHGSASVPLGKRMGDNKFSKIHKLAKEVKFLTKCRIWVTAGTVIHEIEDKSGVVKDEDYFLAFAGYITGKSNTMSRGEVSYVFSLQHALMQLNHGSFLSESTHTNNMALLSGPALTVVRNVATNSTSFQGIGNYTNYFKPANIFIDIWGDAVHPWLNNVADRDGLQVVFTNAPQSASNSQGVRLSNAHAKEGLKLLSPDVDGYQEFGFRDAVSSTTGQGIANSLDMVAMNVNDAVRSTMWNIIINGIANQLMMAVVPRSWNGLVVPFVPACRDHWTDVATNEYTRFALLGSVPRPLRAVLLYGAASGVTGCNAGAVGEPFSGDGANGPAPTVIGFYEGRKFGYYRYQNAPSWMTLLPTPSVVSSVSSGATGKPIATVTHPKPTVPDQSDKRTEAAAHVKTARTVGDAYAQAAFVDEALAGRQAVITGPPRFDIAPGSTLRILRKFRTDPGTGDGVATDPAAEAEEEDALGEIVYGTVMCVTTTIDSQSATAVTAFQLAYVRSASENSSDNESVKEHPIYDHVFVGATLYDQLSDRDTLTGDDGDANDAEPTS